MKKKIWIPALTALVCVALAGFVFSHFFVLAVGTYVETGIVIFDHSQGNPVIMLNRTGNPKVFSNLHTGDKILVLHGNSMMLSDPAQMNVFVCIRLKRGKLSALPESMRERMEEALCQT